MTLIKLFIIFLNYLLKYQKTIANNFYLLHSKNLKFLNYFHLYFLIINDELYNKCRKDLIY